MSSSQRLRWSTEDPRFSIHTSIRVASHPFTGDQAPAHPGGNAPRSVAACSEDAPRLLSVVGPCTARVLVQSSLTLNVMGSMALAPPTGHDPVNNAVTAKDALGIERREGGMSGELSLKAAVAEIASVVLVELGDIGSPMAVPKVAAVDLGPAWV